jgi:hypothetical protein
MVIKMIKKKFKRMLIKTQAKKEKVLKKLLGLLRRARSLPNKILRSNSRKTPNQKLNNKKCSQN